MHGYMHVIFHAFVREKFGEAKWSQIVQASQLGPSIYTMRAYTDFETLKLMTTACQILDAPVAKCFEDFGGFFIDYLMENGYASLIRSCGSTLEEFLVNLNQVHRHAERDFDSAVFPIFEVKRSRTRTSMTSTKTGTSVDFAEGAGGESFRLVYMTSCIDFRPFLKGALTTVALRLFDVNLRIERGQTIDMGHHIAEVWKLRTFAADKLVEVEKLPHSSSSAWSPQSSGFPWMPQTLFDTLSGYWCCKDLGTEIEAAVYRQDVLVCCKDTLGDSRSRAKARELAMVTATYQGVTALRELYEALTPEDKLKIYTVLFQCVPGEVVAAPWTDAEALKQVSSRWSRCTPDADFSLSSDWYEPLEEKQSESVVRSLEKEEPLYYISHTWTDRMANQADAEAKATEVCIAAKNIAAKLYGDSRRWREVKFWVDWCCAASHDSEVHGWAVLTAPWFLRSSRQLIVLCAPTYFESLWCAYEWATFLLHGHPMDVTICAEPHLNADSLPQYLSSIRGLKAEHLGCSGEEDKEKILDQVSGKLFESAGNFSRFVQFSAIALFARYVVTRRVVNQDAAIQPWIDLAHECGFGDLSVKLRRLQAKLPQWRKMAVEHIRDEANVDIQSLTLWSVSRWFNKHVVPSIDKFKAFAVGGAEKLSSEAHDSECSINGDDNYVLAVMNKRTSI